MTQKLNNLEELQNIEFEDSELENDRSGFRNYSKRIAVIIGYMLGVKDEYLEKLPNETEEYYTVKDELLKNDSAIIIRHLNNIRSNIMLRFKEVSRTIRVTSSDYSPIYKIEYFEEDFKELKKYNIDITTGRSDLDEYLKIINEEISKRMENTKLLFPDWVKFKHIKAAFNMPSNIEPERKKYQSNQNYYPFKRYFYWKAPYEAGNILATDDKLLSIIYLSNGDYFTDSDKVCDVSDRVKNSIYDFIENGNKVQFYIDGENTDPYRFAAAIDSLNNDELDKIDKIVVYTDAVYTSDAWKMLKHFVYGIETQIIEVERLIESKSLVDHKLVAGVSKAVYKENVDSIILCSSDSDFWAVIEDVSANYLVMVEEKKCGFDFKEVLRKHNIFYCYLDRFQTPENDNFLETVFARELQKELDRRFENLNINADEVFSKAIYLSRALVSDQKIESLYKNYMLKLKVETDESGNLHIRV